MKQLYAFLLAFICNLIQKHDKKKEAWKEQYNSSSSANNNNNNNVASSNPTRKKAISFDAFIGFSDKKIQDICVSLELSPATTRSGNMGLIIQFLQENNYSLLDLGIYPKNDHQDEDDEESVEESDHDADQQGRKDPDWLPVQRMNQQEDEENFGYDTNEDEEEEYYNYKEKDEKEIVDEECLEIFDHWDYNSANAFQAALITLLHFSIGGQRKQVIEFMTIKVSL